MSIETHEELVGLRRAGRVVARVIRALSAAVAPGTTTAELDAIAGRIMRRAGARSGPRLDYGFPGNVCLSVGDEAVHGIPGARRLKTGELVKLDVTVELDGFYADACRTVVVGDAGGPGRRLIQTAELALAAGIRAASAGAPLNAVGGAVEQTVDARGHAVCRELMGHGIGRRIHEPPNVPNHFVAALDQPLTDGLVLTIEPIVSAGSGAVVEAGDGWTVRSADGAPTAHAEHTLVIRGAEPLVLTA